MSTTRLISWQKPDMSGEGADREVEQHLKASGLSYTILRPVAFMVSRTSLLHETQRLAGLTA